jgi:hypothetical protein
MLYMLDFIGFYGHRAGLVAAEPSASGFGWLQTAEASRVSPARLRRPSAWLQSGEGARWRLFFDGHVARWVASEPSASGGVSLQTADASRVYRVGLRRPSAWFTPSGTSKGRRQLHPSGVPQRLRELIRCWGIAI